MENQQVQEKNAVGRKATGKWGAETQQGKEKIPELGADGGFSGSSSVRYIEQLPPSMRWQSIGRKKSFERKAIDMSSVDTKLGT